MTKVHPFASSTIFCVAFLSFGASAQSPAAIPSGAVLDAIRATGQVTLAHRESSVPFSFVDGARGPKGYALDVCKRLAAALGSQLKVPDLKVAYLQVSPSSRIETIEKGLAQFECGSTTNNAERREKVAFTIPHFVTGARLMVRADSTIDGFDHPNLKVLVSTKKTTPLIAVRRIAAQRGTKMQIVEADDHERAVQMVEKGEADAFAMDDVLLFGLASTRPDPNSLKIVGRFLTTEPLAIMLPKGDDAFKKIVDNEMRRLIYSGELQAMYKEWFEKPIPPKGVSLNLPPSYLLKDLWKYPSDKVPG